MLNIIKNEFRGRYKFLIGALTVILLANFYSLYLSIWADKSMIPAGTVISSLLIIPAIIIAVIYAIQVFSKDVNTDTAYLMFTVPQSSQSIVGGKLVYSLFEYVILVGSSLGLFIVNLFILVGNASKFGLSMPDFKVGAGSVVFVLFEFIFLFAWLIILIYFSIILTRTILSSKKFRVPITFVVFFLINYLTDLAIHFIEILLPFSIKLNTLIGFNGDFSGSSFNINSNINNNYMSVNISGLILQILLIAGMFYLTTYLIDKKLDV